MKPIEYAKNGGHDLLVNAESRLARGEIDEKGWYQEVDAVVTPAYLSAETPWGQSGKSGDLESWTYARSHIADAIARDGTFLDIGCANGFLMECMTEWCSDKGIVIEPYGLDISPGLVELARHRLPNWDDRMHLGNAIDWQPPMRFTYVRTCLEYVPIRKQKELVQHLLDKVVEPGGRLILGNHNEERDLQPTADLVRSWGLEVAGSSERPHGDPRLAYRVLWIDRAGPS